MQLEVREIILSKNQKSRLCTATFHSRENTDSKVNERYGDREKLQTHTWKYTGATDMYCYPRAETIKQCPTLLTSPIILVLSPGVHQPSRVKIMRRLCCKERQSNFEFQWPSRTLRHTNQWDTGKLIIGHSSVAGGKSRYLEEELSWNPNSIRATSQFSGALKRLVIVPFVHPQHCKTYCRKQKLVWKAVIPRKSKKC